MGEISQTEQGRMLREIADATDKAAAFRSIVVDLDDGFSVKFGNLASRSGSESLLLVNEITSAATAMFEDIRAHAQAKLDARVESLHAEFGAMMDPDAGAAKVLPLVKPVKKARR